MQQEPKPREDEQRDAGPGTGLESSFAVDVKINLVAEHVCLLEQANEQRISLRVRRHI